MSERRCKSCLFKPNHHHIKLIRECRKHHYHLTKDDKKVKYYIGITNLGILLLLLKFLLQGRTVIEWSLNHFQQLVMVLMKNDLAYRFNVSQQTISRMFNKWISHMGEKLSPLIRWPDQDKLQKTLPMSFRTFFSKCVHH